MGVYDSRQACLSVAHVFLNHKAHCVYSEGANRWDWHQKSDIDCIWPYYGDCSSTVTAICYFAKGNDPNGLNFTGGNTATILSHAKNDGLIVDKARLLTCDFILFGMEPDGYTPKHVVMAMQPGTVADPICFSMGQQGDPSLVPLSVLEGLGAPIYVHNHTDVTS